MLADSQSHDSRASRVSLFDIIAMICVLRRHMLLVAPVWKRRETGLKNLTDCTVATMKKAEGSTRVEVLRITDQRPK